MSFFNRLVEGVISAAAGLAFVAISNALSSLQETSAYRHRRPPWVVTMLLWACYSLLLYAGVQGTTHVDIRAVAGWLAALGCAAVFCAFGTTLAVLSKYRGPTVRHIRLTDALRSLNVPSLLMLLILFTGLIHGRWFR